MREDKFKGVLFYMKTKLLICFVLLLGAIGVAGSSSFNAETPTYKVADRFAS